MPDLAVLLRTHAGPGRVEWIGLRSERLADMQSVAAADLGLSGLAGDHARPGKRAVTLIQAEHLAVIAALCRREALPPETLRRNIVVSGINLTALRHSTLRVGQAKLQITVPCAPCSRMEKALGAGGYNAMRGHGGWCAEVLTAGPVAIGDALVPLNGETR